MALEFPKYSKRACMIINYDYVDTENKVFIEIPKDLQYMESKRVETFLAQEFIGLKYFWTLYSGDTSEVTVLLREEWILEGAMSIGYAKRTINWSPYHRYEEADKYIYNLNPITCKVMYYLLDYLETYFNLKYSLKTSLDRVTDKYLETYLNEYELIKCVIEPPDDTNYFNFVTVTNRRHYKLLNNYKRKLEKEDYEKARKKESKKYPPTEWENMDQEWPKENQE